METLFLKVLSMSATAAVVILVVLLARLLLRKAPKVFSYALWAVVLFRLLCPFSVESAFSLLPSVKVVDVPGRGEIPAQVIRVETGISAINQPVNDFFIQHPYQGLPDLPEYAELPPQEPGPAADWRTVPTAIWLTGAAILLGYSALSLLRLRRRLVGSVPLEGEKDVRLADHIPSPFVLGVFRPNIYLPSDLPEGERDYVLLHERTHIRRGDHIFRALAWAAVAVHWFNPLVWLAFHLAGKDMEMSCDETVLRKMGRDVRADYSTSLLRLSTGERLPAGPLAFGAGDPTSRIKNVLSYKKPALWVIVIALIGVLCAGVALATDPGAVGDSPEPDDGLSYAFNDDRTAVVITGLKGERAEWYFSDKYHSALCVTGVTLSNGLEDVTCYAFWSSEDRIAVKMELIRAPVVLDYTVLVDGPAYPEQAVIERKVSGDEGMDPNLPDSEVVELAANFAHYLRAAEDWYLRQQALSADFVADLSLSSLDESDGLAAVRIDGSAGDVVRPRGAFWYPEAVWSESPLGELSMVYPAFTDGIEGHVTAWWADEGRTSVTLSTHMTAMLSSYIPTGYWSFTVDLTSGTVTEKTRHAGSLVVDGESKEVRMYPTSISDGEAVKAACVAAKLLTAAEDYYNNAPVQADAPGFPVLGDVWMEVLPGTVTPTGLTYQIHNETGRQLMYGEPYGLQVEDGGIWRGVDTSVRMAFPSVGYILKRNASASKTIDWSYSRGELPPGHYRVTTKVTLEPEREDITLTAEFEIEG